MTEDQKRDLIKFLKENLRLSVDNRVEYAEIWHHSESGYIHRKVLIVHIADEKITEVYL